MAEPQPAEATVTIASQSIELALTGKPDVKNKWGAGSIRPAFVTFTYLPEGIRAHLYGVWVREDGELTDAPCDQAYRIGDTDEWPDWMAGLAREHDPRTAPATDRAAVLRDAADELWALANRLTERGAGVLWAAQKLRRMADETQQPETQAQPRRGDAFEAWLKAQRDAAADYPEAYQAADGLLDLYRLHADTGTPLGEHVCEGRVTGDCECLEQPATVQQPKDQP